MNFSDLNFGPHRNYPDTGIAARHFFQNGYGVSVVRFTTDLGCGSYGAEEGFYELAVLLGGENNYELCYSTPITDDVIGWLSEKEVEGYLDQIQNLPPVA